MKPRFDLARRLAMTCLATLTFALTCAPTTAGSFFDRMHSSSTSSACDELGYPGISCDGISCDGTFDQSCDAMGCSNGNCWKDGCLDWCDHGSCLDGWVPRIESCLPFMKEAAEERGATLPLPFGVSVISTTLRRNVVARDLKIGIGGGPLQPVERFSANPFRVLAKNQIARIDTWLLPCLNLYGLVGHTHSQGKLVIDVERFPFPGSPPFSFPVRVSLDGFTYGGGGTAAIGTPDYFLSLDVNYTYTDFNSLANKLFALVIAPRVGMVVDCPYYKGEFHVGAMYQDTAQTVEVKIEAPIVGDIDVEVFQEEPKRWNFLVGTLWAIDERVHLVCELGMGDREYVIAGITMRM